MPTNPRTDILYRELAEVQAKEYDDTYNALVREVLNFGSNAFVRCMSYSDAEENVDLAPFALYRHILEMVDGVEVLLGCGCPTPALPLLRSAFEALLALDFILEDDGQYRARSLSWIAGYARKRLKSYESLLDTTPAGRDFIESVENDKTIKDLPVLPAEQVTAAVDNMKKFLEREQFIQILAEYESGSRHWYSTYGGPSNLRDLAKHLNRRAQYDVLYRQWSQLSHAQDFSSFIAPPVDGKKAVRGLRDLAAAKDVTTFAVTFLLEATRLLINRFHPEEPWGNWYLREVRTKFMSIINRDASEQKHAG